MENVRTTFCNRILEQVSIKVECKPAKEIIKLVHEYKTKTGKFYGNMIPVVDDGFLFIDGDKIGRIASRLPKIKADPISYYIESRILERQEDDWEI